MKIILASQSPRRKYLLELLGLDFEQIPSNFEEYFDSSITSEELAKELGLGKARDVANRYPKAVVIGSDLVVEVDGKQIGKPSDNNEAIKMLKSFKNKDQRMIASVAVICRAKKYEKVGVSESVLNLGDMSDDFIRNYVSSHNILDRAGGFDRRHKAFSEIKTVVESGRYDNCIGMPTDLLSEYLAELGIKVTPLAWNDQRVKMLGDFEA